MSNIEQTIGNQTWVNVHLQALRDLFPVKPIKIDLNLFVSVGFKLRVMGVDWRAENDLPKIFSFLQRLQIIDIKTFEGDTYVLQHMSPADLAAYMHTQSLQKSVEQVNCSTPPAAIQALVSNYLDKFKKG